VEVDLQFGSGFNLRALPNNNVDFFRGPQESKRGRG